MLSLLFGDFTWGWYHDWSLPQFLNLSVTSNYIFVDIMIGRLSTDPQFSISLWSLIISLCFFFVSFLSWLSVLVCHTSVWFAIPSSYEHVSGICLICSSKFTYMSHISVWFAFLSSPNVCIIAFDCFAIALLDLQFFICLPLLPTHCWYVDVCTPL